MLLSRLFISLKIIMTCISMITFHSMDLYFTRGEVVVSGVWPVRLERWCGGAVMGALVTGNAFSEHLIASLQCRQKNDA